MFKKNVHILEKKLIKARRLLGRYLFPDSGVRKKDIFVVNPT